MIVAGIDIETTGLEVEKGHRIIEICIGSYIMEDFGHTTLPYYTQRINPMRPIDKAAQEVHGISLHDLKNQPKWEDIAGDVSKYLNDADIIVAHNADFDLPFVAHELERANIPLPKGRVFCTMENGRTATPLGKLPNLGELCFAFGVPYDPSSAHAAQYDVDCMMKCFFRGIEEGYFKL